MNKKKGSKCEPLILLTGCINPMGMAFTKFQNPEIRRKQYIEAINFYLKTTDNDIVFVENSDTDISEELRKEWVDWKFIHGQIRLQ